MKIVLDTNVFVSGIFFSGLPADIIKAWKGSKIQIMTSRPILEEYRRVAQSLAEKFPLINFESIIDLMMIHSEIVDVRDFAVSICKDPDDNKFIECAFAGECRIIVSGDKHLLNVSGYKGITVFKPRNFIETFLEKG
jgi:uncharacterized protein